MKNTYAGKCFRCGGHVAAEKGRHDFVSSSNFEHTYYRSQWKGVSVLEHVECHEKYDGTQIDRTFNPDPDVEVIQHER